MSKKKEIIVYLAITLIISICTELSKKLLLFYIQQILFLVIMIF